MQNDFQLISVKDVCKMTSLSRTSIWKQIRDGRFPKPVGLNDSRRKAFISSEVKDWIAQRVAERDQAVA